MLLSARDTPLFPHPSIIAQYIPFGVYPPRPEQAPLPPGGWCVSPASTAELELLESPSHSLLSPSFHGLHPALPRVAAHARAVGIQG